MNQIQKEIPKRQKMKINNYYKSILNNIKEEWKKNPMEAIQYAKKIHFDYELFQTLLKKATKAERELLFAFLLFYYKKENPSIYSNNFILCVIAQNEYLLPEILDSSPAALKVIIEHQLEIYKEDPFVTSNAAITSQFLNQYSARYTQYIKQKQEEERREKKELVEEFINSNVSLTEFRKEKGLILDTWKEYLAITFIWYPELKPIYKEKMKELENPSKRIKTLLNDNKQKNNRQSFAIIMSKAHRIANQMRYGVSDGSKKRPYDIIDYYSTTSIDYETLLNLTIRYGDAHDYYELREFFTKNGNKTKLKIRDIYETKIVAGRKKDNKGDFIENTGIEITLEEKKFLIGFMRYHHLPFTHQVYDSALNRYLNGFLTFDESYINNQEEEKKLTLN